MDLTSRPTWLDGMRVLFRRDTQVAILIFDAQYPDIHTVMEVGRYYTAIPHLRLMVEVLKSNLAEYDSQMEKFLAEAEKK